MEVSGGGNQVKHYGVLRPLESGPDIRVFLVQSGLTESASQRVLTLIPAGFQETDEGYRTAEHFYNLRSQTRHPLLPEIQGLEFRGKQAGFVTSYLADPTLYEAGSSWPFERRLEAAQDILLLVEFLHRRGIHAGWLSPAKVFCHNEDLTTVNLVLPSEVLADTCPSVRSLRYCAPEVLGGWKPDTRSDAYSLGMLLYYLLTGSEPFSDSNPDSIRRKQVAVNPTPVRILKEDLPPYCQVLIDGLIRKRPQDRFSIEQALQFLSENTTRTCWHVPSLSTPMLGRPTELEHLQRCLDRFVRNPRPLVAVVSGPAGIGKTFLTEQLVISARMRRLGVLHVAHRETDGAFEALRHSLENRTVSADSVAVSLTTATTSLEGRDIIASILELARAAPLVIRATDLQWLDEGSLEIYRQILGGQEPVMLLGDRRSDEPSHYGKELTDEFRNTGRFTELPLDPLSTESVKEILASAIGTGWPDLWLDQTTRICAGNPFHLTALLAFLRDRGQLSYGSLGWSGQHLLEAKWEPPHTVSEGLRARVERLGEQDRRILDYLALFNRPAELDLLSRAIDADSHQLLDRLRRLERLGFLEISGSFACPLATLSHRWLHAVLEQDLSPATRKQLHQKILNALVLAPTPQERPGLEELARHSIAAGSKQAAKKWTKVAVAGLRGDRLFRQASVLFERAISEGCLSPLCWEDVKTRIELLFLAGNHSRCEDTIRLQLAGHCSRSRLSYLWTMLARIRILRGSLREAGHLLEQAHSLCHDEPAFLEAAAELVARLSRAGKLAEARHLTSQLLQMGGKAGTPEVVAKVSQALFYFFRRSGLYREAIVWSVRSIRASSRLGDSAFLARLCLELGAVQLNRGDYAATRRLTRYGIETAGRVGNAKLRFEASLCEARLANRAGRHSTAERLLREWTRQAHRDSRLDLNASLFAELSMAAVERLRLHLAERYIKAGRRFLTEEASDAACELASVDGRLQLLIGKPEKAIEMGRLLAAAEDRLWQHRGALLLCSAYLATGNVCSAEEQIAHTALRGWGLGPSFRIETRLLQARVQLARDRPDAARVYVQAALRSARQLEDTVLIAEALALSMDLWTRLGLPQRARVLAGRALQVLQRVDRPLLHAQVLAGLATAEVALGRPADGEKHFSSALERLQANLALFSPHLRSGFSTSHIEPLERQMARSLRKSRQSTPLRLVSLTQFTTALTGKSDPTCLARSLLKCLREQLGITAGSCFWTNPDGGIGAAAASTGQHRFDARRMVLAAISGQGPEIEPRIIDGTLTLVVPLDDSHGTAGWLYAERVGPLPEVEFDLLGTVKAIIQLALSHTSPRIRPTNVPAQVHLQNGRVLAGRHPQIKQMIADARKFAATESTVLICGESGTGKELIARAIHEFSSRREEPFIAVNCASFAIDLIESQLFGHARGAFTGATDTRIGFFEAASGGTLLLDEISSMPLTLQPRLLRVLQEKQIIRLGETCQRAVDTRVLAATNCDLKELCERGLFRPDLFHRLNVLRIDVPPLRDRSSDIPVLIRHFLEEICGESGMNVRITAAAMDLLRRYSFPGNVRELRNLLESLVHTCSDGIISPSDVETRLDGTKTTASGFEDPAALERIVEEMVEGRSAFWSAVRQPFLDRDLAKRDVIRIVSIGLDACGGNYRRLIRYFGLDDSEYKKFLNFLSHHDCKVDFRQFRRQHD